MALRFPRLFTLLSLPFLSVKQDMTLVLGLSTHGHCSVEYDFGTGSLVNRLDSLTFRFWLWRSRQDMAKHPSLQRPAHSVSILGIGLGERLDLRAKWKRLFSLLGGLETKLFRSFSSLILRLDCFVLEGWWR
ncbi:hypothetical protein FOMG_08450 [Fusarium oxysporum f. sp. melonis 26406]|uniref:Secreted protein n=1 Tax=Fusarium oxysporum f. sp. melonis 26406 TaxID=1089452 RepID=X0A2M7_FUSOX|nr:hypothetical protein FOMG_08450 [Fusarium oxysporum f. sp. melonis 26406]